MFRKPMFQVFVGVVVAALLLTVGVTASAQTLQMNENGIARTNSNRLTAQQPNWISKADCLNNDAYLFPLSFSDYAPNDNLEVWVGTSGANCTNDEDRRAATQVCWKVASQKPTGTSDTIEVPVRRIVAANLEGDENSTYTKEVCEGSAETNAPRNITLYFMFINEDVAKSADTWDTAYDLVGPEPPTDVEISEGDTILLVDYTDQGDVDVNGYYFYCDPPPGEEPATGTDTDTLDGGTTTFAADVVILTDASGDAGEAAAEAGTEAGTEAGADAEADAAADTGPTGPTKICETPMLYAGAEPPSDPKYRCGTGSRTSGKITGLVNGVTYSVAVAGVDQVGNVGKLSTVGCNSPTIVDDFYRVYRDAGGQAGGGFCTTSGGVGHGAGISGLVLIAIAAIGGSLRRRRLG